MLHRPVSCRLIGGLGAVALAVLLFAVGFATNAGAATAPGLGAAASYAVLGGQTVTNTGPTTINGDLGVSPGTAVTNFPPGIVSNGSIHSADANALQAQSDVTTAYNALAAQPCTADLTGQDLGGMTLTEGVYCFSSSAQLTGQLTLNAQGNASAVFIFKTVSTLTTASNASILVTNGGVDCNVFWKVGSSAIIGTGTVFVGNILALTSISLTTGGKRIGQGPGAKRRSDDGYEPRRLRGLRCTNRHPDRCAKGANFDTHRNPFAHAGRPDPRTDACANTGRPNTFAHAGRPDTVAHADRPDPFTDAGRPNPITDPFAHAGRPDSFTDPVAHAGRPDACTDTFGNAGRPNSFTDAFIYAEIDATAAACADEHAFAHPGRSLPEHRRSSPAGKSPLDPAAAWPGSEQPRRYRICPEPARSAPRSSPGSAPVETCAAVRRPFARPCCRRPSRRQSRT